MHASIIASAKHQSARVSESMTCEADLAHVKRPEQRKVWKTSHMASTHWPSILQPWELSKLSLTIIQLPRLPATLLGNNTADVLVSFGGRYTLAKKKKKKHSWGEATLALPGA